MGLRFGYEPLLYPRGQWKNTLGCSGFKKAQRTEYKWKNSSAPLIEGDLVKLWWGSTKPSCFQRDTGKLEWKSGDETATHAPMPPIHGVRQIIFRTSGLVSVDPKSGRELWRQAFLKYQPLPPGSCRRPDLLFSRIRSGCWVVQNK